MKISDGLVLRAGSVVLVQHKCIGNSDIEQKVEEILVELSTFHPEAIITSKLVASIHPSHELVVGDDGFWTWHGMALESGIHPSASKGLYQLLSAVCWLTAQ